MGRSVSAYFQGDQMFRGAAGLWRAHTSASFRASEKAGLKPGRYKGKRGASALKGELQVSRFGMVGVGVRVGRTRGDKPRRRWRRKVASTTAKSGPAEAEPLHEKERCRAEARRYEGKIEPN